MNCYYLKEDVFGIKKGTLLDEDPENPGFFSPFASANHYIYIKPELVVSVEEDEAYKQRSDMILATDTQGPKGIKDDSGKTQWWYMDNFWPDLEQVVDVLTYGDLKYPAEDGANWKRLDNPEQRLCDALLRHVLKYRYESKDDPETQKSHLAHAITNALMLMYFDRNKKGN